jgi:hypothetical protein
MTMSAANDPPGVRSGLPDLVLRGLGVNEISRRVAASGRDLHDNVRPSLQQILQLEGEQPWGDDEVGEDFLAKVYHTPVNGTPFNQLLHTVLSEAGAELIDFGAAGKQVTQRFTEVDSAASRRLPGARRATG